MHLSAILPYGDFLLSIVTKGFNWGFDSLPVVWYFDTHFVKPAGFRENRGTLNQNGIVNLQFQDKQRVLCLRRDDPLTSEITILLLVITLKACSKRLILIFINSIEFVGPNVGEELA